MNSKLDYLVIGAGPAGLQLGYYLQKNARSYLILERGRGAGTFFETYPRHRMLISINKVHTGTDDRDANLRWDWNSLLTDGDDPRFGAYTTEYFPGADDLVRYLRDFAARHGLRVQYDTDVTRVARDADGTFVVTDRAGRTYRASRLFVASGFTKENVPTFPGAELCERYGTHDTDAARFTNKRVLILGKGNSSFETANHLTGTAAAIHVCSPESIQMAWQTHYVGNLRAVNNNFLDTYQLKSQNTVIDGTVTKVERLGDQLAAHIAYSHAAGQTTVRLYDAIIACTGFKFDPSIFDASCQPELVYEGKFPAQTAEWESVNVPGLYFAGTLMHACDFRRTMSGFIHGFRHNVQVMSRLFEMKYHGREWPYTECPATPDGVLVAIMNRLRHGAGIYLQPGFLRDVIVVDEASGQARCYTDMRNDYIPGSFIGTSHHYYTVSLEYGHFDGDPFAVERNPDPMKGGEASYLHPVIRRYDRAELKAEYHIQDDLENEWWLEEYARPARAWFDAQLSRGAVPAGAAR